jgi:hypothetical protein
MGDPAGETDVRVLVNPDRHQCRRRLAVDLGIEDIRDLGDHGVRMGEVGVRAEAVDCRELGEVDLGRRLEGKILEPVVFALELGLACKAEGTEAGEILLSVLVAFLPREAADGMGLAVGNGDIAVAALLHVPDNLLHHHQVAKMRVATRHEPGENVEWRFITYRPGNGKIITVPDYDAAAHKIRDFGEFC